MPEMYGPNGDMTWDQYVASVNPTGARATGGTHTTNDPDYAPGMPKRLEAESRGIRVVYMDMTSTSTLDASYQRNMTSAQLGEEPNTRLYIGNPDGSGGELTITYIDGATETFETDRNGNRLSDTPIRSTPPTKNLDGTTVRSEFLPEPEDLLGVRRSGTSVDEIAGLYPWAEDLGFLDLIRSLALDDASPDEIVAQIRRSDLYKQQFPGMAGPGGVRRFKSEADYIQTRSDLRDVMMDYGRYDPATDSPLDYVAFFEAGIDPNELSDRLGKYTALEQGSQELRDAFYVYGGMNVTVDDLFEATVSPAFRQSLQDEYDYQVAGRHLNFPVWIQRATDVGLAHVAEELRQMQSRGELTGSVAARVAAMDPEFGKTLMGALFGGGTATPTLSLSELTRSFTYAVFGSAASEAGWVIPTKERLDEFINAGLESDKLRGAYNTLTLRENAYTGMVNRAGRTDVKFMGRVDRPGFQELFEQGLLGQSREITYAQSAESARGARGGGFAAAPEGRRFAQRGRSTRS